MKNPGRTLRLSRMFSGPLLGLALVAGVSSVAQAQQAPTRYGSIAVSNNKVTWRGHVLHPVLTGNSGLMLSQPIKMGDSDIVLVQSIGGSFCPATVAIVQVDGKKEHHTNFFGTCSDLVQTKTVGDTLEIRMPSMHHKGEQRLYTYHEGQVSKDGVLLNTACAKGVCDNFFGDD